MNNKNSNRSGYFFLSSFEEAINCLEDEKEELALYRAITRYGLYKEDPEGFYTSTLKLAWALIKPVLKKAWNNKKNGEKGGAPKGNQNRRQKAINNPSSTQVQPEFNPSSTDTIKDKGQSDKGQESERYSADAPAPSEDFLRFQTWITEHAPEVAKMKQPFSEKEFREIQQSWPAAAVRDVLEAMSNKRTLTRDYVSAYKTCKSWLKRRAERQGGAGTQKDETTNRPKVTRLEDLR